MRAMLSRAGRAMLPAAMVLFLAFIGSNPGLAHDPPGTTTGRSCDVWWEFEPAFRDGVSVRFSFSAHAHAPFFAHNSAREAAANTAWECAEAHWESRLMAPPPRECLPYGSGEEARGVLGYPEFPNLHAEATRQLCAANPGREAILTNIYFHLAGNEGCLTFHPWNTHLWVSGYEMHCPPANEQGMPAPPPPPSPPQPSPLPDPLQTPPPSPVDAFTILPDTRLPGLDIALVEEPGLVWQHCARMCLDTAGCRAWTWRPALGARQTMCLLKSGVGMQVPDSGFWSGILN